MRRFILLFFCLDVSRLNFTVLPSPLYHICAHLSSLMLRQVLRRVKFFYVSSFFRPIVHVYTSVVIYPCQIFKAAANISWELQNTPKKIFSAAKMVRRLRKLEINQNLWYIYHKIVQKSNFSAQIKEIPTLSSGNFSV